MHAEEQVVVNDVVMPLSVRVARKDGTAGPIVEHAIAHEMRACLVRQPQSSLVVATDQVVRKFPTRTAVNYNASIAPVNDAILLHARRRIIGHLQACFEAQGNEVFIEEDIGAFSDPNATSIAPYDRVACENRAAGASAHDTDLFVVGNCVASQLSRCGVQQDNASAHVVT
jgi:hypothetical protein